MKISGLNILAGELGVADPSVLPLSDGPVTGRTGSVGQGASGSGVDGVASDSASGVER